MISLVESKKFNKWTNKTNRNSYRYRVIDTVIDTENKEARGEGTGREINSWGGLRRTNVQLQNKCIMGKCTVCGIESVSM